MKRAVFSFIFLITTLLGVGEGYAAIVTNLADVEHCAEITNLEIAININGRYAIKRSYPSKEKIGNEYFHQCQKGNLSLPCYQISTCLKTPRFIHFQVLRH